MPVITASETIRLRVTAEMRESIDDYCAQHGLDLSEVVREAVLRRIGRKDLIPTMPGRGQPRKSAD